MEPAETPDSDSTTHGMEQRQQTENDKTSKNSPCFLSCSFGALGSPTISCRNEEGKAVDWFVFYKIPKRQGKEGGETGLEYLYLDASTRSWRRSEKLMNMSSSALGQTLHQLYEAYSSKSNNTAYVIYNDGIPKSENYSRKYGHSKGLLLWNRIQGFWLIHSIPGFPPIPEEGYDYPSTGRRNGQSGICITFKYSQYEAIDYQLLVSNPNIYSCSIPATFLQELVHMPELCTKSASLKIPGRHLTTLQSAQGQNFLHFAKSDSFREDIFVAWIAQQLKTHLLAETWQRERQELPSNCSLAYHVYNIKAIKNYLLLVSSELFPCKSKCTKVNNFAVQYAPTKIHFLTTRPSESNEVSRSLTGTPKTMSQNESTLFGLTV